MGWTLSDLKSWLRPLDAWLVAGGLTVPREWKKWTRFLTDNETCTKNKRYTKKKKLKHTLRKFSWSKLGFPYLKKNLMDSGYTDRSRGHHSEANPQFTKQKKERLALDRQQHEGNRIHIHPTRPEHSKQELPFQQARKPNNQSTTTLR